MSQTGKGTPAQQGVKFGWIIGVFVSRLFFNYYALQLNLNLGKMCVEHSWSDAVPETKLGRWPSWYWSGYHHYWSKCTGDYSNHSINVCYMHKWRDKRRYYRTNILESFEYAKQLDFQVEHII